MRLLLTAVDVAGPGRWRWLLTDEVSGASLADFPVELDLASDEVARFADLHDYVRWHAAPDRRVADGARIVAEAGNWAGRELLGEAIGAAIAAAADSGPVTVRVAAGPGLDMVLLWPLELAHVAGQPLAARGDVTFVYDIGSGHGTAGSERAASGPLRVLAVFSQPTETDMLALRRERYALSLLIRQIASRDRAAVELRVVQYGVTRARLKEIAEEGAGWDVLHLSGHGAGGAFLLENPDGSPDVVPTADLVRLLHPVRGRVRLAVVSACESAADTTAETYRLLGLVKQAEALEKAQLNADAGLSVDGQPSTEGMGTGAGRQVEVAGGQPATRIPGLARALVRELGCAVVAMRYPVTDEFAIEYGDVLYKQLLARRQTIDVAAARAVAEATEPVASAARPAVSAATPGVFGAHAIGLRLEVPRKRPQVDTSEPKMAYFDPPYGPGEPERFVGRAATMAKATAALAPRSGQATVLLHGMAGSGKTTCAMELAYRNAERFGATAFWQAPTKDDQWQGALENLATRLEVQLGGYGFAMNGHIVTATAFENYLPLLRHAMRNSGVLLVLDNLETLLTPGGTWRDPRWAPLISTLTGHDGESRVIMTSRIAPSGLGTGTGGSAAARVLTLPVHALSLNESVALARELPNLRALLHADAGPVRTTDAAQTRRDTETDQARAAADRQRVRRVLRVVQGHPKLMELADAAAADRTRLDAQLAAAEAAAGVLAGPAQGPAKGAEGPTESQGAAGAAEGPSEAAQGSVTAAPAGTADIAGDAGEVTVAGAGGGLEAFFRDGTSTLDPDRFLDALAGWTAGALGVLPTEARLMAEFVACLEDDDRVSYVIDATWANLWRELRRPGDPPAPRLLLDTLASAALVEAVAVTAGDGRPVEGTQTAGGGRAEVSVQPDAGTSAPAPRPEDGRTGARYELVVYRVHPGVAAAIIAAAGPGVRDAADTGLAASWTATADQAREGEGGEDSGLVVRAGLAAAPYLLRRGDWDTAGRLLEHAVIRDGSPGTVQAALPGLRRIAAATGTPADTVVLALALRRVDPGEAERLLRAALADADAAGDYRTASAAAGELVNLLLDAGRLAAALTAAGQRAEFTRRAGLGPWTQLSDQGQRLQVLGLMGEHARVLAELAGLRAAMAGLPARPDASDPVAPWGVREVILDTGLASALATGDWQRCLDLNAEIAASQRRRGAGVHEVTRTRFNDAGPLIELGRTGEAGRLLAECQRVCEDHADTTRLARVLSARADLEAALGHRQAAADLERAAIRLSYARPEARDIAISHHNLANHIRRLGGDRAGQRAHRLAAALIRRLSGDAHNLTVTVRALAAELREDDGGAGLPVTVAEVTGIAERAEGVRLGALLAALEPDPRAVEDALAGILRTAVEIRLADSSPDAPDSR